MAKSAKSDAESVLLVPVIILLTIVIKVLIFVVALANFLFPFALFLFTVILYVKYRSVLASFNLHDRRSLLSEKEHFTYNKAIQDLQGYCRKLADLRDKLEKLIASKQNDPVKQASKDAILKEAKIVINQIKTSERKLRELSKSFKAKSNTMLSHYRITLSSCIALISYLLASFWISRLMNVDIGSIVPAFNLQALDIYSIYHGAFPAIAVVLLITVVSFIFASLLSSDSFKHRFWNADRFTFTRDKTNESYFRKKFKDIPSDESKYSNREEHTKSRPRYSYRNELERYLNVFGLKPGELNLNSLKNAYRNLMKKYHPDTVIHESRDVRQEAEFMARELNSGYQYLREHLSAI